MKNCVSVFSSSFAWLILFHLTQNMLSNILAHFVHSYSTWRWMIIDNHCISSTSSALFWWINTHDIQKNKRWHYNVEGRFLWTKINFELGFWIFCLIFSAKYSIKSQLFHNKTYCSKVQTTEKSYKKGMTHFSTSSNKCSKLIRMS